MINDLAMQTFTLPVYLIVLSMLGIGILFSLGCNLTHKSRLFYILPVISGLIGYLFIHGALLDVGYGEEYIGYVYGLVSILPILYIVLMAVGAYNFGESNISRHQHH